MYNPFKMWGSYVGLVGFPLLFILFANLFKSTFLLYPAMPLAILFTKIIPCSDWGCLGVAALSLPVTGFLLGWGIHSLIRWRVNS